MQHRQAGTGRKICEADKTICEADQTIQPLQEDNDQKAWQQEAGDLDEVKAHTFQREFNILEMEQNSSVEMNSSERQGQEIENNETRNNRQVYVQLAIVKEENKSKEQTEEKIAQILDKYICDQILVEWQSQSASNCEIKIQQNQVVSTQGKSNDNLEEEVFISKKQPIEQICKDKDNQNSDNLVYAQQIKDPINKELKSKQPSDRLENTINIQRQRQSNEKITENSVTTDVRKNKSMIWFGAFLSTLLIMIMVIILWDLETLQSLLRKFIIIVFGSAVISLFYLEKYMKNKVIQDNSLPAHTN